jgi:hypothetical protein
LLPAAVPTPVRRGPEHTGKSALLLSPIAKYLPAGQGLAVLDPQGDLAETMLLHVPRNRSNVMTLHQRARQSVG